MKETEVEDGAIKLNMTGHQKKNKIFSHKFLCITVYLFLSAIPNSY
jgi:hypothetical protein